MTRFVLTVSDEGSPDWVCDLALDGSEPQKTAAKLFDDACAAYRHASAARRNEGVCNYHVDGRPRTPFEIAANAWAKKMIEIGWDDPSLPTSIPEYHEMVRLRPPPGDPYWQQQ